MKIRINDKANDCYSARQRRGVFLKTAQEPGSLGRFHFRYVLLKLEGHFKIAVLSGGVLKRLLPILQREQTADNPFGFQVAVGDVLDNKGEAVRA